MNDSSPATPASDSELSTWDYVAQKAAQSVRAPSASAAMRSGSVSKPKNRKYIILFGLLFLALVISGTVALVLSRMHRKSASPTPST